MRPDLAFSFLISAVLFSGCDFGAQKGKFVVNSMGSTSLVDEEGHLSVVGGHATPLTGNEGDPKSLLYVLVLAPGFNGTGGGGPSSSLSHITKVSWAWANDKERIEGELTWDRQSEKVKVIGREFDRTDGQAFVVISNHLGRWNVTQHSVKQDVKSKAEALKQIQESLPADSPAKSVKLHASADVDHWK